MTGNFRVALISSLNGSINEPAKRADRMIAPGEALRAWGTSHENNRAREAGDRILTAKTAVASYAGSGSELVSFSPGSQSLARGYHSIARCGLFVGSDKQARKLLSPQMCFVKLDLMRP